MEKMIDPSTTSVVLLAGGASGERDISLASGAGAREALEEAGFPVTVLDPAIKADLVKLVEGDFDVAFICLHGKYGEDGTVQGLLELLHIPYIGSDVWSSATAIDKARTKVFYRYFGINTPQSIVLKRGQPFDIQHVIATVGLPCVVKPASEGSALGVHIVEDAADVQPATEEVFTRDEELLVETYVKGKELTVSVVGNEKPIALPIIEIVPKNEFYDFESKYAPGGSQHICPARLDDAQTAKVQQIAIAAHRALGCRGVSRTDIIMDEEGICWVLETNTLPGMTSTSLLPDSARAGGISFPELCTMLIQYALE